MGLVSEWVMPDSRSVVNDRCDTPRICSRRSYRKPLGVMLTLVARLTACCTCSFHLSSWSKITAKSLAVGEGLMALPFIMSWPWLALVLFFFLPGDANEFSLFRDEAEFSLLGLPATGYRTSAEHRNSGRRVLAWGMGRSIVRVV